MQPNLPTEPVETLPAVQEAIAEVTSLEAFAKSYQVATAEQYSTGGEELRRVKAAQKRLEDTRTSITKPMNDALKRVNDFFRAPGEKLTRIESAIKRALIGFEDEQRRKQQEDQRRADEAARKERERIEAQARKAAESGKAEKAAQLETRAASVVAPVIHHEPPKVAGVNTRNVIKHEIMDASQLPRLYLVADEKKIAAQVRALGMDANIPGVRVWIEKQIAAGAA